MDFLPPQAWGRPWQGFRFIVTTWWHQFFPCLILNILQVNFPWLPLLIFYLCILHLLDQHSLILKSFPRCDYNFFVGHIQIRHTDLLSPQVCGRWWKGYLFCDFTFHHQYINWMKGSHLNNFLLFFVNICFRCVRSNTETGEFIYKHNHHKRHTSTYIYCYQGDIDRKSYTIKVNKGLVENVWWWKFDVSKQLFK